MHMVSQCNSFITSALGLSYQIPLLVKRSNCESLLPLSQQYWMKNKNKYLGYLHCTFDLLTKFVVLLGGKSVQQWEDSNSLCQEVNK